MPEQTVLAVDDSPTELKKVVQTLQKSGYAVKTAVDGEDALAKAAAERPAVMVLDVILPKKNGFQVCRQLKTSPDLADIKIILLTSKSQDADRFWGLKQGADLFLTKPFVEKELLDGVARLMKG